VSNGGVYDIYDVACLGVHFIRSEDWGVGGGAVCWEEWMGGREMVDRSAGLWWWW
jgi:hypothetical protein